MRKFFTALMAVAMLLIPSAAFAEANDNANCLAQARSQQKGQLDVETARAIAQALGQNETSNGVGAWMSFAGQADCS